MFISLTSTDDLTQPILVRGSAIVMIESLDQNTTLITLAGGALAQIEVKETRHKVRELVEGSKG